MQLVLKYTLLWCFVFNLQSLVPLLLTIFSLCSYFITAVVLGKECFCLAHVFMASQEKITWYPVFHQFFLINANCRVKAHLHCLFIHRMLIYSLSSFSLFDVV